MSAKITLFLIAGLGLIIFLGVQEFGSQIEEVSRARTADFNQQEVFLSGQKPKMQLISTAFENGGLMPRQYTCDGGDVNPRLEINNVPADAKSLVLIFDDQDAVGGVWNHWMVWNISPETKTIGVRSIPRKANVGMNDFGEFGYSGPCPPSGEHRYIFQLYALSTEIDLPSSAGRVQLEEALNDSVIEKTGLMARYTR